MSRKLITLFSFTIAMAGPAAAQKTPQPSPRDRLNGEWTGTLVLDNSSPRLSLVFQVTDSAFTGKVFADGDLLGAMEGGSLKENTVHFNVDRFDFTGTINGASMKVALIVWNGSTRNLTLTKMPAFSRDTTATPTTGRDGGAPRPPRRYRRSSTRR